MFFVCVLCKQCAQRSMDLKVSVGGMFYYRHPRFTALCSAHSLNRAQEDILLCLQLLKQRRFAKEKIAADYVAKVLTHRHAQDWQPMTI